MLLLLHGRYRSKNPNLILKPAYCKTTIFQASFFNRNVKPWNFICNLAPHDKFPSLVRLKSFCAPLILLYWTVLIILTCPAHGSSHVTALAAVLKF